ncbi:MAG TPA: UbiA prenyltransferase family protein [Candidatus Lokiarchaeia archaeon]|nr:UbiA prenyltransferase family protein [Candidatus Lokiarchaeia archaeon]
MGKIKDILSLLRVQQWYKSAVLLVGPLFSGALTNLNFYPSLILGLIYVSFASSFNYIMNDLLDIEKDRQHPEKLKKRPLAAGRMSKTEGVFFFIIVGFIAFVGSYLLNFFVFLMVIAIVVNGTIYNLVLKHYAFVDILTLSMVYIWRALAGCYIVNAFISPWLIVAIFLLAMYLVICKRRADLEFIGQENAVNHKEVYDQYSLPLLDMLHNLTATSLFLVYTLYTILGPFDAKYSSIISDNRSFLLFSIPVALYLIMRYSYLMTAKSEVARSTERVFFDKGIIIGGLILMVIFLLTIYVPVNVLNVPLMP